MAARASWTNGSQARATSRRGFHRASSRSGDRQYPVTRRAWLGAAFELGVVSNGCGNVEKLCADFGYTPLSVGRSSIRGGWDFSNRIPRSFIHAAEKLGGDPGTMMMVGDSFDRDVRAREKGRNENGVARRHGATRMSRSVVGRSSSPQAGRSSRRLVGRFAGSRMNASGKSSLESGVLAAGRGERLRTRIADLKPLVKVGGQTLIEHVLGSMAEPARAEVVVIINEDSLAVRDHVVAATWPFALRWIVETTPSSMHSFLRLVETLATDGDDGRFFFQRSIPWPARRPTRSSSAKRASSKKRPSPSRSLHPANDEKPLLVRTRPRQFTRRRDRRSGGAVRYATAGIMRCARRFSAKQKRRRRDGIDALAEVSRAFTRPRLPPRGNSHRCGQSMSIARPIFEAPKNFSGARRYEAIARSIPRNAILAGPSSLERCAAARSDRASAAGARIRRRPPDAGRSRERARRTRRSSSRCAREDRRSKSWPTGNAKGVRIINSPQAALNTHRDRLPALMVEAGIPFPQTHLVGTKRKRRFAIARSQRRHLAEAGDVHASVTADVQWVDSAERLEAGLADFAERGIELAALQAHRAGRRDKILWRRRRRIFPLVLFRRGPEISVSILTDWRRSPTKPPPPRASIFSAAT